MEQRRVPNHEHVLFQALIVLIDSVHSNSFLGILQSTAENCGQVSEVASHYFCEMANSMNDTIPEESLGSSARYREHLINGLSGLVAGACGIFVGHPFDTMKIRLQVGDAAKKADVGAKTISELYRGIMPPLLTAGCTQFIVFTIYEHVKLQLRHEQNDFVMSNLSATFTAATIAGAISSYVTSPFQLIKVQQQSSREGLTLRQVFSKVTQTHGWRGLFHGAVPVLAVEGVGRGVYMLTYEFMKQTLASEQYPESSMMVRAAAASCGGSFSWLVMYPLDSIKSRRLSDLRLKSSFECYKATMKAGGIPAFYRGCAFAMLRSVPVAATILPLYEHCREQFARVI